MREVALSKITKIMAEAAPIAARSLKYLSQHAKNEIARERASKDIIDFIAPPERGPMVQVNTQVGVQSYLNLPVPPGPAPVTSAPALAATPSIRPELSQGAGEIGPEVNRRQPFETTARQLTDVTDDRPAQTVIESTRATVRAALRGPDDKIFGKDF